MSRRSIPFPSRMRGNARPWTPSLLFALTFSATSAFPAAQTNKTESTVTGISMTSSRDEVALAIDVSGPSPAPTTGTADGPPRVYVDFRNVRPGVPGVTASTDERIVKVRTAVHSGNPLVTRVVVELAARMPYRVARDGNRTTIFLAATAVASTAPVLSTPSAPPPSPAPRQRSTPPTGKSPEPVSAGLVPPPPPPPPPPVLETPSIAPAPPLPAPPPSTPASSIAKPQVPFRPPPTPPVSKDLEKYQRQVSGVLDRLRLQKPLLASLDGKEVQTTDRLQVAAREIEKLRSQLVAIKPPETLRTQHDMLIQASTLALMATELQLQAMGTNDTTTARNAMSAAAGALMILNRACADLLCRE
jgi:AMIN domain